MVSFPKKPQPKFHLTWDHLRASIMELALKLPKAGYIWGMPRGGQYIANMLSEANPKLQVVQGYLEDSIVKPTNAIAKDVKPEYIYVIDDIVDSGNTLLEVNDKAVHPIASLFHRPTAQFTPEVHLITWKLEHWIVFPWDREWDGMLAAAQLMALQDRDNNDNGPKVIVVS